jgi:hypothetical protein
VNDREFHAKLRPSTLAIVHLLALGVGGVWPVVCLGSAPRIPQVRGHSRYVGLKNQRDGALVYITSQAGEDSSEELSDSAILVPHRLREGYCALRHMCFRKSLYTYDFHTLNVASG